VVLSLCISFVDRLTKRCKDESESRKKELEEFASTIVDEAISRINKARLHRDSFPLSGCKSDRIGKPIINQS
jgi:hypothetical protein